MKLNRKGTPGYAVMPRQASDFQRLEYMAGEQRRLMLGFALAVWVIGMVIFLAWLG